MWFVVIGVLMILLKVGEIGPVAQWSWWLVLAPFPLATIWWAFADKFGYTQREAMRRMDQKKDARRQKALEALGQGDKSKRRR
ncbi:TIGR04438 family Trp-rich protein [Pelomonas sp. CA6]|uniref:TIGR04438 family Trp-rich protein n=1 Tax=Pelomonas sp. CA6 TaxID=2907999 RepID=UPI001F4B8B15|nr:TIGR04438 family Trp-rich protein [Pelomonas sp. CA6]MCH7342317.1 TIGR04438 family Trp-rich protein [Pelomonas sp. CA6]